ncbi:MAG: hypothetical protein JNM56_25625 [Planctomycetia bacterium]|nr:hypothetical protein [Planctomycetia bacterium]
MQAADILEFVRRKPFRPFRITLTDGRSYEVQHPEFAMVGRTTVAIGLRTSNGPDLLYDRLVTVDLLHIMEAELLDVASSNT